MTLKATRRDHCAPFKGGKHVVVIPLQARTDLFFDFSFALVTNTDER